MYGKSYVKLQGINFLFYENAGIDESGGWGSSGPYSGYVDITYILKISFSFKSIEDARLNTAIMVCLFLMDVARIQIIWSIGHLRMQCKQ